MFFTPQRFWAHRRGGPPLEDDVGGLHKEGAQVLVATLGDPAELGAIAGRLLLGDEAEPGGEVATLLEAAVQPRAPGDWSQSRSGAASGDREDACRSRSRRCC